MYFLSSDLQIDSVQWVNEVTQNVSFGDEAGMHPYFNTCESVHILNPVRDNAIILLHEFFKLHRCEEEHHLLLPRFEAFAINFFWHQSFRDYTRNSQKSWSCNRSTCGSFNWTRLIKTSTEQATASGFITNISHWNGIWCCCVVMVASVAETWSRVWLSMVLLWFVIFLKTSKRDSMLVHRYKQHKYTR